MQADNAISDADYAQVAVVNPSDNAMKLSSLRLFGTMLLFLGSLSSDQAVNSWVNDQVINGRLTVITPIIEKRVYTTFQQTYKLELPGTVVKPIIGVQEKTPQDRRIDEILALFSSSGLGGKTELPLISAERLGFQSDVKKLMDELEALLTEKPGRMTSINFPGLLDANYYYPSVQSIILEGMRNMARNAGA